MHDLFPRIIVSQPQTTALADAADFATVVAMAVAVAAVIVSLFIYYHDKRPDVVAYLDSDPEKSSVYFVIENVGKGVAYDIEISDFDFEIAEEGAFRDFTKKNFVTKGVPMLVPGKYRRTVIATTMYASQHLADKKSEVTVSCSRKSFGGRRKQSSSYTLDYYSFSNTLRTDSDMHIIAQGVKKLAGM